MLGIVRVQARRTLIRSLSLTKHTTDLQVVAKIRDVSEPSCEIYM